MSIYKNNIQHTLKMIGLALVMQNILFANQANPVKINQTEKISSSIEGEKEVIHMDSMGEISILLLIILTSTVGSLFLRDQPDKLS